MKNVRYDICGLLQDVCGRLAGLGVPVYAGKRPSGTKSGPQKFVVVSVDGSLYDNHVQQQGYLDFELFCRDKGNGLSDMVSLQGMLDVVTELMPVRGGWYSLCRPELTLQGGDGYGNTVWLVSCVLRVNTTWRYAKELQLHRYIENSDWILNLTPFVNTYLPDAEAWNEGAAWSDGLRWEEKADAGIWQEDSPWGEGYNNVAWKEKDE